jgi:beta-mannosidase
VYWQRTLTDLGGAYSTDNALVFAIAELVADGKSISRNLIYLVPTKQVHLPAVHIATQLTQATDGYDLKLSSPVLARSVYVSFGDATAELSDNYFDLLPLEPVDVFVKSRESLESLKTHLRVVSLADAFPAESTSK